MGRFWDALYSNPVDYEDLHSFFSPDAHYEDVPAPDLGADGPAAVVYRLKVGIDPVPDRRHELHRMVGEGDTVVTEHTETWHFRTGEEVALPFVSVMEVRDGKIALWKDYSNLDTLIQGAPQWWLDHIYAQPWPPP